MYARRFWRFWPHGYLTVRYVRARSLARYPTGQTGAAPCPPSMRQSTACSPRIWCSLAGRVRPSPGAKDLIASAKRSKTKFADLTCVYCHEPVEPYCRRSNASVRPRKQRGIFRWETPPRRKKRGLCQGRALCFWSLSQRRAPSPPGAICARDTPVLQCWPARQPAHPAKPALPLKCCNALSSAP